MLEETGHLGQAPWTLLCPHPHRWGFAHGTQGGPVPGRTGPRGSAPFLGEPDPMAACCSLSRRHLLCPHHVTTCAPSRALFQRGEWATPHEGSPAMPQDTPCTVLPLTSEARHPRATGPAPSMFQSKCLHGLNIDFIPGHEGPYELAGHSAGASCIRAVGKPLGLVGGSALPSAFLRHTFRRGGTFWRSSPICSELGPSGARCDTREHGQGALRRSVRSDRRLWAWVAMGSQHGREGPGGDAMSQSGCRLGSSRLERLAPGHVAAGPSTGDGGRVSGRSEGCREGLPRQAPRGLRGLLMASSSTGTLRGRCEGPHLPGAPPGTSTGFGPWGTEARSPSQKPSGHTEQWRELQPPPSPVAAESCTETASGRHLDGDPDKQDVSVSVQRPARLGQSSPDS